MLSAPGSRPVSLAVIGVGNEFRRDDGVGPAVVARIRRRAERGRLPAGTSLWTCDGDPARLIALWDRAHGVVLVDAARAGSSSRPGRVRRFALADARFPRLRGATSSHGLGLADALELALVLDRLPANLIAYAVEIGDVGEGPGLSAAVNAAVEPVALRVEAEARRLARLMADV